MSRYVTFEPHPPLQRPVLVCAFLGWNDAGQAATTAATYLAEQGDGRVIGRMDPEEFLDFQVSRPTVRLEDGVSRVVEWPALEFVAARHGDRDLVVFSAPEPNNRWRTFAGEVLEAAREIGAGLLLTLGAFLTDVSHTRPVPVVGSAATAADALGLGLTRSEYEGPTGMTGVLHDASNRAGLPSVSIWAAVPHYLPSAANPKAALALVRRAAAVLGVPVDLAGLTTAAETWEREVADLMSDNDELAAYVRRLEEAQDEEQEDAVGEHEPGAERSPPWGEVPSAEAIGAEVERFLREHGSGPHGGERRG